MSNMGYCRFRNTLADLRDCEDHLDEVLYHSEDADEERLAAVRLIRVCQRIAQDYESDAP